MKTTHEATMDHDNVIRLVTVGTEAAAHAKAYRIAADVIDALSQARVACLPEIVHVDTQRVDAATSRVITRIRVEVTGDIAAFTALRRIAKAVR